PSLQTTRLPTIALWQWPWAVTFTRVAATPPQIKPGATIQAPTPGMMLQSPICLRAARLPPLAHTTAGGYSLEATSTSPLATARSQGTPLLTLGLICQTCYKPAITWQGQAQGNPSTPSPATLVPALLATITSNTPKPPAAHRQQHLPLRQQQHLLQVRRRQQL